MVQWEYLSLFLEANFPAHEKELRAMYPNERMSQFTPRALVPEMNKLGAEGWELILCHPYSAGGNADILTHRTSPSNNSTWTNLYFCVFKRLKNPD